MIWVIWVAMGMGENISQWRVTLLPADSNKFVTYTRVVISELLAESKMAHRGPERIPIVSPATKDKGEPDFT